MQRDSQPQRPEPASTAVAHQGWLRLLLVGGVAAAVVVLAEWSSSRLVPSEAGDVEPTGHRPDNIRIVSKFPANLDRPGDRPSVWLFGNSHTYALPGLQPGEQLRPSAGGVLIDELAGRMAAAHPDRPVDFYLVAYPNFLPFEMLTRAGHAIYAGHRPTCAVIGITWRNVARDSLPRHTIYQTYRDRAFSEAFEEMLAAPPVEANRAVLDEVRSQQRRAEREDELEKLKSDSDRIDERLTDWLSDRLTLMGRSAELRAQLFRTATHRVQELWRTREGVDYSYDLVPHDLEFNVDCLLALVRLLTSHGTRVICYFAPQRDDLPPLMDPAPQQQFMESFARDVAPLGVTIIDARKVVPNEYWGWVGSEPDRSHFTEPGHQRLAQFLLDEVEKRAGWKELHAP